VNEELIMNTVAGEFDRAVALRRPGEGRWHAEIQDGWDFAGTPNGGYLLSLAAAALIELTGRPDPITMTAHYLAPARPGSAELEGEILKAGRRHATARGALHQGDRLVAQVLGTFGELTRPGSSLCHESGLPDLPPPESCITPTPGPGGFVPPPITERIELRLHPAHVGFAVGRPHGRAEMGGWARFADGRPVDTLALPLLADCFPPPIFNCGIKLAWVPTIELTVHVHKRPAPGWLGEWFTTDHIAGGYLEEDGVIWDSTGDVVAVSRQMAILPR
jgi:acyl-CoA thioesterase